MKHPIRQFFLMILLFHIGMFESVAQILDPADWEFMATKVGATEQLETAKLGETIAINIKVILDDTWYIYSNDQDPDIGPRPTQVKFELHPSYVIVGALKPFKVKEKFDNIFMGPIRYIDETGGGFVQQIKVLQPNPVIRGTIVYSVCSMETGQCIFPEEEFEINVLTQ